MSTSHPGPGAGSTEPWHIRTITEDEYPAFHRVVHEAFGDIVDQQQASVRDRPLMELDRSLAAFDGDRLVGTATASSFTMTLPGGPRPVGAIGAVAVHPLYRRRGVLTALMHRELADIHRRGETVAALFSSESSIYGRFGFGTAGNRVNYVLSRGGTELRGDAPRDPGLRLDLVAPREARAELAAVHARAVARRAGEVQRLEVWWEKALEDLPEGRNGGTELKCVLVRGEEGPVGYALYRIRPGWTQNGLPDGALFVEEINTDLPAGYTALWEYLAGLDLVNTITVLNRPPDDPILHLLADPRRARLTVYDGIWLRLVDLGRALEQRAYAAAVDTVIEVTDTVCPWNAGRWHLRAGKGAAECERTDRKADLRLDTAALASAYPGGVRLGALLAAGLVTEHREGAAAELSTALTLPTLPFCGVDF